MTMATACPYKGQHW